MCLNCLAQGQTGQRSAGNDRLSLWAVDDFPAFAYESFVGQRTPKASGKAASSPYTLLIKRMK